MDTNLQWMNDNIRYFNEWLKYNDSWQGKLQIIGNNLVCKSDGINEAIDISHYYLPNILENPVLREQIQIKNMLQADDIFRIIRVNILAEKEDQTGEFNPQVFITNVDMKQDEDMQFFLVIEDNQGHKFKITKNMELVLQLYQDLLAKGSIVYFEEFKQGMERIMHE